MNTLVGSDVYHGWHCRPAAKKLSQNDYAQAYERYRMRWSQPLFCDAFAGSWIQSTNGAGRVPPNGRRSTGGLLVPSPESVQPRLGRNEATEEPTSS